jgi:hypothetical protein
MPEIAVATLGHSLVKPSLYFKLTAKTISARPAENNKNQAKKHLLIYCEKEVYFTINT